MGHGLQLMTSRRSLPGCLAALVLWLAAPAPAPAAVPPDAVVANGVVTLAQATGIGDLSFRTTYGETTATGIATPGPLRLDLGVLYRIRTCVWAKAPGAAPASVCESSETRPNAITIVTGVTAPTARMTIERPTAGQTAATIAGTVLVDRHNDDNTYTPHATSWPSGGLPAAGLVVPAVDQAGGQVLGPQGIALAGVPGGGINTGAQDSICREDQVAPFTPRTGSADALGELPFAYEVNEPATGPARGVMLLLHGGGWSSVGEAKLRGLRADAERWRARGWRTVNATHRPCAASVADVVTLYDRVRRTYGAATPICAFGRSSGGHLALVLATRRSQLACAIPVGGLADLGSLARQTATGGARGPATIANLATAAFGADRLSELSATGAAIRARVLYPIAVGDTLVPWEQATELAAAQRRRDRRAYVDILRLAGGDVLFEHALVSAAALQAFYARERALVAPLTIGDVTAPARLLLATVRSRGVRARFTCGARCTVSARLQLSARTARRLGLPRVVGRGSAKRSSRGRGIVSVRLTAAARRRLGGATLELVSDVRAGGKRRRQTATVAVRRS
jgi:acetyl esterase/lipase